MVVKIEVMQIKESCFTETKVFFSTELLSTVLFTLIDDKLIITPKYIKELA